jgi:hypothetical protein
LLIFIQNYFFLFNTFIQKNYLQNPAHWTGRRITKQSGRATTAVVGIPDTTYEEILLGITHRYNVNGVEEKAVNV